MAPTKERAKPTTTKKPSSKRNTAVKTGFKPMKVKKSGEAQTLALTAAVRKNPFTTLPPELRNRIYEEVLVEELEKRIILGSVKGWRFRVVH